MFFIKYSIKFGRILVHVELLKRHWFSKDTPNLCLKSIVLSFLSIKWLRFCYSIRNTCINSLQVLAGRQWVSGGKTDVCVLETKTSELVRVRKVQSLSPSCMVVSWSTSLQCGFRPWSLIKVGVLVTGGFQPLCMWYVNFSEEIVVV